MSELIGGKPKPLILNPAALGSVFNPPPDQQRLLEVINRISVQISQEIDKFLGNCLMLVFPTDLVEMIRKEVKPLSQDAKDVAFREAFWTLLRRCEVTNDEDNSKEGLRPTRTITCYLGKQRLGFLVIHQTLTSNLDLESHLNLDFNAQNPVYSAHATEVSDFLVACVSAGSEGARKLFNEYYPSDPTEAEQPGKVPEQNSGN